MAQKKREVAALNMDPAELAGRIQHTFEVGYKKIVSDGDIDDAVGGLTELLARATEAIDAAERAAEAARAVRVAIIKCQVAVGMTMEDIGAVHGLTRQRIGQLLRAPDEHEDGSADEPPPPR